MTQLYSNLKKLPVEKQQKILLNAKNMLNAIGEQEFVIRWFAYAFTDPVDVIHGYLVRLRKIRSLK